jgi:hypothetical protein
MAGSTPTVESKLMDGLSEKVGSKLMAEPIPMAGLKLLAG